MATEYKPPCFSDKCERPGAAYDHTRELCKGIGTSIISAGGVGILEIYPCPTDALMEIGGEQTDPLMAEIRTKLGVTTYYEDPSDSL